MANDYVKLVWCVISVSNMIIDFPQIYQLSDYCELVAHL